MEKRKKFDMKEKRIVADEQIELEKKKKKEEALAAKRNPRA